MGSSWSEEYSRKFFRRVKDINLAGERILQRSDSRAERRSREATSQSAKKNSAATAKVSTVPRLTSKWLSLPRALWLLSVFMYYSSPSFFPARGRSRYPPPWPTSRVQFQISPRLNYSLAGWRIWKQRERETHLPRYSSYGLNKKFTRRTFAEWQSALPLPSLAFVRAEASDGRTIHFGGCRAFMQFSLSARRQLGMIADSNRSAPADFRTSETNQWELVINGSLGIENEILPMKWRWIDCAALCGVSFNGMWGIVRPCTRCLSYVCDKYLVRFQKYFFSN